MTFSNLSNQIFRTCIAEYHKEDNIDAPFSNPYPEQTIENFLYHKCWIDTVQWHLEDIIRDPEINPVDALALKRRIDKSNQERTDLVEMIDSYFLSKYASVQVAEDATINTESPAWAVDRLSILNLKIYHWEAETQRTDISAEHMFFCSEKLDILAAQQTDLSTALDTLLDEIEAGKKYMKVYRQLKMYNDPELNPVLYSNKANK